MQLNSGVDGKRVQEPNLQKFPEIFLTSSCVLPRSTIYDFLSISGELILQRFSISGFFV